MSALSRNRQGYTSRPTADLKIRTFDGSGFSETGETSVSEEGGTGRSLVYEFCTVGSLPFPVPQINSWKLREKDTERESGVQII